MKNFAKLLFISAVFAVIGAFQSAIAQSSPKLTCLAQSKVTTPTAQIALHSENENIGQVRIMSEQSEKPLDKIFGISEPVFLIVNLQEGTNKFTLSIYDEQGNLDKSATQSIVITRIPVSVSEQSVTHSESSNTGNTATISAKNNFQAAEPNSSNSANKQLKLNAKREITDGNKYTLEIDSNGIKNLGGDYNIEVQNVESKTVRIITRKIGNDQKSPQTEDITLEKGTNIVTVYPKANGQAFKNLSSDITLICSPCDEKETQFASQRIIFRSIIGYEQSGASSAKSEQHPFLNFFFNTPINIRRRIGSDSRNKNPQLNNQANKADNEKEDEYKNIFGGFSVWGDIRLTTTPVQSINSLASFSPAGFATNFVQGDSASKVNDLVKSFDFLVGFEQQIIRPEKLFPGSFRSRTSLSLIAAGGAITPLSFDKFVPVFYNIPTANGSIDPNFRNFFSDMNFDGKTKVAFITPDRDRFFRQYYAGLRLKTFFEQGNIKEFPAMFDITVGQNEAITSGLKGVILRLDGSTPLPIGNTDFLYLFGSVNMKLGRKINESIPPFFLNPATGGNLSDNDTAVISIDRLPFQTRNRDIFRIGVGVNLFKLFEKKETTKP